MEWSTKPLDLVNWLVYGEGSTSEERQYASSLSLDILGLFCETYSTLHRIWLHGAEIRGDINAVNQIYDNINRHQTSS
jgi:hypothetical protein